MDAIKPLTVAALQKYTLHYLLCWCENGDLKEEAELWRSEAEDWLHQTCHLAEHKLRR